MKFEYNAETKTSKFVFSEEKSIEIEGEFEQLHDLYHWFNRECEKRMDARVQNLKLDITGLIEQDYLNY